MLTLQRPLICMVIQDAFEHMHAYLVFTNTFPNLKIVLIFACDSLVAAAEGHQPEANAIREQFQQDEEYFNKVVPLVCHCICLSFDNASNTIGSHVLGYAVFVVKLRTTAMQ
jgi:hypothetical protein